MSSLSRVVRVALVSGTAAGGVTFTAAPLVRRVMLKLGTLDVPNHRSSHTAPVPRGGGIACVCGVAAAIAVIEVTDSGVRPLIPIELLAAPALMTSVGYADDHFGGLPALPRLAAQLLAGTLAASSGVSPLARPLVIMAMPALVNVVNFMDGINGITGSTAVLWGVNACFVAFEQDDIPLAVLGSVAAGAGIGFLPWNAPHARLFLGDAGSYLFGGIFAAALVAANRVPIGMRRRERWTSTAMVAAPLVPYIADGAQALVRRACSGDSIFEAHREHTYQQLVDDHGLSHVQTSTIHSVAAVSCALASRLRPYVAAPTLSLIALTYVALPAFLTRRRRSRCAHREARP